MKRMYGEQRHLSVLRTELDDHNEVEYGWFNHGHAPVLNRYEHQTPTTAATSTSTSTASSAFVVSQIQNKVLVKINGVVCGEENKVSDGQNSRW